MIWGNRFAEFSVLWNLFQLFQHDCHKLGSQ